ncbi:HNH endonuclease [Nocardia otitidiscaviarum]|uniref:HNH endonuclease n=1 Tax=Nocardia otitidiscaviarum TaxID=1823 RepID=A0A378YLR0_9NOCA|nr:HNH endonuclease [Nocardia otitidiscaviarum]MBF6181969.1 HNH endonuclease [Nocardia otitidiscaviarum]MBF6241295.1 HNH endonuclease [Nocardia otitidiscaviarum]MCP9620329.1 HNH endonuclease [Nocardia otitidiscaviarum]SUA78115.1 HNH endonuclease [Nocardia otitidiscaviarum]
MKQRHGARHEARTHRQLQPADVHNRGSGAPSLHVLSDHSYPGARHDHAHRSADSPPQVPSWAKRRVLLLNATYEPLTALSARRAIVLLICDKADAVHDNPEGPVVHSAGAAVALPSVIRLRNYVRVPYRARVPMTRAALMHRDRYRCAYCGGKAETIDHVIPRSRGGAHSWENCVASCAPCNHRKADKLLSELGWTLRHPMVAPKGPHWRLLSASSELDPVWLQYLGEDVA